MDVVRAAEARALLLAGLDLARDPARETAGPASTLRAIERLGFVQLDSINVVERAHHHILWTRMHSYRPALLDGLQRSGRVFEHWTHDASVIPSEWFPHWRHRFGKVSTWAWSKWLTQRLGRRRNEVLRHVLDRVRVEGPRMARDFEHAGRKSGPWWDWKPAKAALEYWWRAGELAVPRRENFQKVYDLTERVLPRVHGRPEPAREEHIAWACGTALERLGTATARELAAFWGAISAAEAAAWCAAAEKLGEVERMLVEGCDGSRRPAFARPDWRERAKDIADGAVGQGGWPGMRLLSPFDPLIRDRARCLRLMGFDYRFEAFVPEPKRKFGYYVLPILEGDRLVGRLDPKLDRVAGVLRVRGVWWEPGVKPTRRRRADLDGALTRYAAFVGADRVEMADR